MDAEELKRRTKIFGLKIIRLVEDLPSSNTTRVIGNQLIRSGTSVGANYRAACRARSKAEFIAKMGIVIEEADESMYWMEMLIESGLVPEDVLSELLPEADELEAIVTASVKTARSSQPQRRG
jgi:four helix bundle protein